MSRERKFVDIARLLQGMINSKALPEGEQLEAIPKMAKRYNTSVATISKAFDILEQQGYIDRIPGKGVYSRRKPSRSFAVLFDSASDGMGDGEFNYKPTFCKIFHRLCAERGYKYEIFNNVDSAESCEGIRLKIEDGGFDVVLVASRFFAEHFETYMEHSLSIAIGLYNYRRMRTTVSVSFDSLLRDGGGELFANGCERVAILLNSNNPKSWSSDQEDTRLRSYKELLLRNGVLFSPKLVKYCTLDPRSGYEKAVELVKENKNVKMGIIGTDSLLTTGLLLGVAESGAKLNRDVFVASHVNPECPLAKFPSPVFCYEAPIADQIEKIFDLVFRRFSENEAVAGEYYLDLQRIE